MRQIMAGKGSEESSTLEIIKEAEDMKQNLVRGWWALQGIAFWPEINSIAVEGKTEGSSLVSSTSLI